VNLVQVDIEVDGMRHAATGTVLGHRHGRMVELDGIARDAIPEPPSLVTFHRDAPGVVGRIGTLLGSLGVNIARMQTCSTDTHGQALAILQVDRALDAGEHEALARLAGIERVVQVH
jgi:D-3-phosphoglycerate dehydrogenase